MDENNPWINRFNRERRAKKEAERLLEEKSLELYNANQSLEKRVQERTLELENALHEAQLAKKAKDTFLASMSHELRTPLNSIIGFSQILSMQKDVPEKLKKFIENINISGNSLLRLINSILNFSKLESDEMELQKESFSATAFIQELIVLVQIQAREKNIIIHTDVSNIKIFADKQLLNQAILNLLSNAVKFTQEKGEISITLKQETDYILIKICDNGIGISQENQEKLFHPFIQIKNKQQTNLNGTGLGLYLTKKIVDLHQGTIVIESESNKGTCFIIKL